ncbi:hypothetical protein P4W15_04955 [Morganella morganii]|nr:hypothetical protein [Morganella morganii]
MFRLSRTFIAPLLLLFSASLFAAAETKPAAPADLDLVFVLDKSGSMSGFEQDTIGGYNSVLAENRKKRRQYLRHHRFIQPRKQYAA